MAYQPKSYRKFLAASVSAAVVGSALAPVAGAASFTDVQAGAYYTDAVNYLADKGVINGVSENQFAPNAPLTRAAAAKIIALSLGLDVEGAADAGFPDTEGHWAEATINAVAEAGIVGGRDTGLFDPNANVTRAEMAKMIAEAYDLTTDEAAASVFTDVPAWAKGYVGALVNAGITNGVSANAFGANDEVTRAQAATFVYRAEGEESVSAELEITNVSALTDDGHVLAVEFNKAPGAVTKGDVQVYNTDSKSRNGVDTVEVYGNTVEITLYDDEDSVEIERLTTYTVKVNGVEYDFVRPGYVDADNNARVTEVDSEERTIYVDHNVGDWPKTLDVPEGIDLNFQEVLGQEIKVWFNGDDEVVDFELEGNTVLFDAFEVTETYDESDENGEIELDQAEEDYELASDVKFYLNGDLKSAGDLEATFLQDGDSYDAAKIVLNGDGDVQYIYAFNWDGSVITEKVEENNVVGYDEDLDLEDYIIVKDGKQITVEDIKPGDIIFYNEDAYEDGYAEVFNNSVVGELTGAFGDGFEIDGDEIYEYGNSETLDSDGDIQSFGTEEAEDYEGTEVTVYLDRKGDVVFVDGNVNEENTDDTVAAYVTDNILAYEQATRDTIEIEYLDENGEEDTVTVRLEDLEKITYNNNEYDVDDSPSGDEVNPVLADSADAGTELDEIQLKDSGNTTVDTISLLNSDNTVIKITKDENGDVTELEFFNATADAQVDDLGAEPIESGDDYAETDDEGNKKLSDDVVIFDTTDGEDAEDIKVSKYSDLGNNEITDAVIYFNDDDEVEAIVLEDDTAEDSTDEEIIVTESYLNSDDEVVRLEGFVNGEEKTYDVDDVNFGAPINEGDVLSITINDETGEVENVRATDAGGTNVLVTGKTVQSVDLSDDEIRTNQGDLYELVSGAEVYDVTDPTDIETASLRDVRDIDPTTESITLVLDAAGQNRYVKAVLITSDEETTD